LKGGDKVKIIKGEHEGKTGEIIGEWITKGMGEPGGKDISGWWFVEFDGGGQSIIQEPFMKMSEPEWPPEKGSPILH